MKKRKPNRRRSGNSEGNGSPRSPETLTLSGEAELLIHLAFEGGEEIIVQYPHHAAYCFASIACLVQKVEGLTDFERRVGMWLWMEVLTFQTEEALDCDALAEHFETDTATIRAAIDALVNAKQFKVEWSMNADVKVVPRLTKESVLLFAEQVLEGIETGEREEEAQQARKDR